MYLLKYLSRSIVTMQQFVDLPDLGRMESVCNDSSLPLRSMLTAIASASETAYTASRQGCRKDGGPAHTRLASCVVIALMLTGTGFEEPDRYVDQNDISSTCSRHNASMSP